MSASTPLVWYHSRADASARLVLLAIADHDGEGGAWPSIPTLARMTRLSESTVRRALKQLAALGELVVHLQEGGTTRTPEGRRPNRYEIRLACPPECDGTARHACRECGGRGTHKPDCRGGVVYVDAWDAYAVPVDNYPCHHDTPATGDTPTPVTGDTPTPVTAVTPEPPKEATPEPPEPPTLPESLSSLWGGEGIDSEHQHALWAALLADPDTNVPAARGRQRAWYVPALAKIRAAEGRSLAAHLDTIRRHGEDCEHGTPGGAEPHPITGLPLCPLCRREAAS